MTPEEASGVADGIGVEGFPGDAKDLRGLYTILLVILGLALLTLIVGWLLLALNDREIPEGLPVLAATIGGGLVGVLAQPNTKG